MQVKKKKAGKYLIVWIICIVCAVILFFETINHRLSLNDFRVYYEATKALIAGDQVYGIAFGLGSGLFKYSPFVSFLFIPFSILPFSVSGILYILFIVTALILSFLLCQRILVTYLFENHQKHGTIISILTLVFVSNHLYRELHLGNTNIILLFLILISLKLILKEKDFISGILFGIALLLKPYLLLLGIVLVLHKKWKVIAGTLAMMCLQVIILLVAFGFSKTLSLNVDWLKTIIAHSESYGSQNNIAYIMHILCNIEISSVNNYIIIIVSALILSVYIIFNLVQSAGKLNAAVISRNNFMIEWLVLFAALPSIVNTDTQHFMYSLPLIMIILYYIFQNKEYMLGSLLVLIFLLYGTNSNDLVGNTLGNFYDRIGAVGISNILIILIVLYINFKENKNNNHRKISSPET